MNYKQKYLKYKLKYLTAKKIIWWCGTFLVYQNQKK